MKTLSQSLETKLVKAAALAVSLVAFLGDSAQSLAILGPTAHVQLPAGSVGLVQTQNQSNASSSLAQVIDSQTAKLQ